MKNIKPDSNIIIDASRTTYLATDVLELIQEFTNVRAKEENIKVELIGFKTSYEEGHHSTNIVVEHSRTI